eukprot:2232378-Prymnesium_polylepis.1
MSGHCLGAVAGRVVWLLPGCCLLQQSYSKTTAAIQQSYGDPSDHASTHGTTVPATVQLRSAATVRYSSYSVAPGLWRRSDCVWSRFWCEEAPATARPCNCMATTAGLTGGGGPGDFCIARLARRLGRGRSR